MAYSYPLSLTDFFSDMPLMQITMQLGDPRIKSGETGMGEVLTANIGNRLWHGDVIFQPAYYEDADGYAARCSILEEAGASFYVYNGSKYGPRNDPKGTILGATVPKISSVNANNRDLTLKSLPSTYKLAPGDELAFPYGSSPVRQALHRVVKGGTASGGILIVEVSPRIRSGAVADIEVDLIQPTCKAIMLPNSFDGGTYADGVVTGMKFSWQQTLR